MGGDGFQMCPLRCCLAGAGSPEGEGAEWGGWGGNERGTPRREWEGRERGGGEGKAGQGREEEEEEARASFSCPRSASESREPCGHAKPGLGIAARAPPAPRPGHEAAAGQVRGEMTL